jgi:hypothetical protein
MKRQLSLTIAIVIVCAAAAVNAHAQTSAPQKMRADIPFAFNVGEKTLPAGVYTLAVINPASDRKALQIRSLDGRFSAITQTSATSINRAGRAKLVFRRYGDRYFFAQIDMAGDTPSLVAAKSQAERSTRRALARTAASTIVTLVAH